MIDFLPDTITLIKFSIASFILFVTPGPDMSLFLSRTMASGRNAGIASVTGASIGCLVHTLLAAFGISALVAASHMGFLALKIAGAAYLLWLAVSAIRHGSSLNVSVGERKTVSALSSFLVGITVNLTNPKVVLFYITFLPQFVTATDPHVTAKLLFLGAYSVLFTYPPAILMILGAEQLVTYLKQRPKVLRGIDYTFAAVFAFFALTIATTEAKV